MDRHELVVEMRLLEQRLAPYEEKYAILSEGFYTALTAGELERFEEFDETRADFSRWKGIYETWRRRKTAYGDLPRSAGPSRGGAGGGDGGEVIPE